MKVALIHDWLTGMRGGERCLEAFLDLYPQADIFTLVHIAGTTTARIDSRVKQVSFLQKIPGISRLYRHCLPLFPWAIKSFDLSGYDLVISLSHAAAKNVRVPKDVPHICYCFTPMRYIWDQAENYFGKVTKFIWPLIKWLRVWDYQSSQRVTCFVAISKFVAARIRCFYGRQAKLIYPPVDTSWIKSIRQKRKGEAFLYAGALVPYKKVDLVIEAFNQLDLPLWVVGSGPDQQRLRKMAKSNISFYGRLSDHELAEVYAHTRALVFPGTEDFGLIPVECMAAGRPVIGINDGALKESIKGLRIRNSTLEPAQASGVFIEQANVPSMIESIRYFIDIEDQISPESCIMQAQQFSLERFYAEWNQLLIDLGLVSFTVTKNESAVNYA